MLHSVLWGIFREKSLFGEGKRASTKEQRYDERSKGTFFYFLYLKLLNTFFTFCDHRPCMLLESFLGFCVFLLLLTEVPLWTHFQAYFDAKITLQDF